MVILKSIPWVGLLFLYIKLAHPFGFTREKNYNYVYFWIVFNVLSGVKNLNYTYACQHYSGSAGGLTLSTLSTLPLISTGLQNLDHKTCRGVPQNHLGNHLNHFSVKRNTVKLKKCFIYQYLDSVQFYNFFLKTPIPLELGTKCNPFSFFFV